MAATHAALRAAACPLRATSARPAPRLETAAAVRGARIEWFEAAHLVNLEHPDRFNRTLREFIDGVSDR